MRAVERDPPPRTQLPQAVDPNEPKLPLCCGHSFVQMRDSFYFRNHLCIVFELLSINLYEFIKNNNFQVGFVALGPRLTRVLATHVCRTAAFDRACRWR